MVLFQSTWRGIVGCYCFKSKLVIYQHFGSSSLIALNVFFKLKRLLCVFYFLIIIRRSVHKYVKRSNLSLGKHRNCRAIRFSEYYNDLVENIINRNTLTTADL